jgi:hypothetical protein
LPIVARIRETVIKKPKEKEQLEEEVGLWLAPNKEMNFN